MSEREALFPDARRKLVVGTEVLRTGGGASLTAGECNAVLDRLADLETALRAMGKEWMADMVEADWDPADAEEEVREAVAPGVWASVRDA